MKLTEAQEACRCYATGLGIHPKGVHVGEKAKFKVHTQVPVSGSFSVKIICPDGSEMGAAVCQLNSVSFECSYIPWTSGLHQVIVRYCDQLIANSPFEVEVEMARLDRVRAFGPGLSNGVVGFPAKFTIEIYGELLPLRVFLRGKDDMEISSVDNEDGSTDYSYSVAQSGRYSVHILNYKGEHVACSPHTVFISDDMRTFDPTKVEASGPGLNKIGNTANKLAEFKVDTRMAGTARLEIEVFDGNSNSVKVSRRNKNGIHSCNYMPLQNVKHTVLIKFGEVNIPSSPYRVFVQDPEKLKLYGPAINFPLKIFQPTYFIMDCSEAGTAGDISCHMIHEKELEPLFSKKDSRDNTYRCDFEPIQKGIYVAKIHFAGIELPAITFKINSALEIDVSRVEVEDLESKAQEACRCYATGLGVHPKGVHVGEKAKFKVHTQVPVSGGFSVKIICPDGSEMGAAVCQLNSVSFECSYIPWTSGLHQVIVRYCDQLIANSPFEVEVEMVRLDRVRAYGPGLKTGVAGFPASFTLETHGGSLPWEIKVPDSPVAFRRTDYSCNSVDVIYLPLTPGECAVHILDFNGEDYKNSPYKVIIKPASTGWDPKKVEASGPGLNERGNTVNKWAEFKVDTRKAGKGHLIIQVVDVDDNKVYLTGSGKDGLFSCQYMPTKSVKHTVIITFNGVAIRTSPYRVFIQDASKVKVYGPAIDHPVKIFQTSYLIVDYSEAGPGVVQSYITDNKGSEQLVVRRNYKDKTLRIDIDATEVGLYDAKITFDDTQVPGSPFKINVIFNTDVSKVKVEGLELRIPAGDVASFGIITKDAGEGQAQVKVSGPSGKFVVVNIEETAVGLEAKFTPIEIGFHSVQVVFAGQAVPQSPFRCETFRKDEDAKKVKAYGSGLNGGKANATAEFIIDAREVDQVSLSLLIKGPCDPDIAYVDNQNGTYNVC